MCPVSHVMCRVQRVTCNVSRVTCDMKYIYIYIFFFFFKFVKLVGGGYVINGAYPVQFYLKSTLFSKNKLPHGGQNTVFVGRTSFPRPLKLSNNPALNPGIDIKDIPNVHDGDTSITLNGFFLVRWTDRWVLVGGGDCITHFNNHDSAANKPTSLQALDNFSFFQLLICTMFSAANQTPSTC